MALFIVLLMLSPLAVVYGLRKAERARAAIASGRRTAVSQGWRMLVFPAVVAVTGGMALVHYGWIGGADDVAGSIGLAAGAAGPSLYTGNGVADVFLWIALTFGNLMVFLFFVSIPYVTGSLFAAALVLLGRGAIALPPAPPAEPSGTRETTGADPS